jgi:FKBP-type peptidyl-prolyl cis-trans isomerase
LDDDASYAFGMLLASDLRGTGLMFNYDSLFQGFKDYFEGKETRLTESDAGTIIQTAYTAAISARTEVLQQQETEFLLNNAKKDGVKVTTSGLQYEVIIEGTGPKPVETDAVRVHYEGTLVDGTVFDNSYIRGEPIEFSLDGVIRGWTEGLQLMSVGSTYRFYIPSNLGYGEYGNGSTIPPYSALIFKVELLGIVTD